MKSYDAVSDLLYDTSEFSCALVLEVVVTCGFAQPVSRMECVGIKS